MRKTKKQQAMPKSEAESFDCKSANPVYVSDNQN